MSGSIGVGRVVHLAEARPPLPRHRLLVEDDPASDAIPMDVVFVGAGPAGLAGAIELAKLVRRDREEGGRLGEIQIAVFEKAAELGGHSLSGAVIAPGPFRELFPEVAEEAFPFRGRVENEALYLLRESSAIRVPIPPSMRNPGNRIASICEVVRWMGGKAEALGVNVFTGFPVESLLVGERGVRGVRTAPSGLDREGNLGSGHAPPLKVRARVTVLAEGTRGPLTQAWLEHEQVGSTNPQIYGLGVKELWRVARPLDRVVHTLGWPLERDTFGGSWIYPMDRGLVSLGLVVGLDSPDARLDPHALLQRLKTHPMIRVLLEGGELVEWGAKTIPEGGFHSLPRRRHGAGLLLVGDAAGYVDVPSLKGIHYAVQSGMLAARAIFRSLVEGDTSEAGLRGYTESVDRSFIAEDLHRTRNMRGAFRSGLWMGALGAGAMMLTGGRFPGGTIRVEEDLLRPRVLRESPPLPRPDGTLTFSKQDAVFRSGNHTRDDLPSHLVVGEHLTAELADLYAHLCPAGVYERDGDRLIVNAPNCVDCKATDVLGPRWTVREGGSGPAYRTM